MGNPVFQEPAACKDPSKLSALPVVLTFSSVFYYGHCSFTQLVESGTLKSPERQQTSRVSLFKSELATLGLALQPRACARLHYTTKLSDK